MCIDIDYLFKCIYSSKCSSCNIPVIWSVFQTYKLFEKLAEHDRERLLTELRKREESQRVPPAVQELEITDESHKVSEEQSSEVVQAEGSSENASDVSSQVKARSSSERSSSPDHASAASKDSDQWVKQLLIRSLYNNKYLFTCLSVFQESEYISGEPWQL